MKTPNSGNNILSAEELERQALSLADRIIEQARVASMRQNPDLFFRLYASSALVSELENHGATRAVFFQRLRDAGIHERRVILIPDLESRAFEAAVDVRATPPEPKIRCA